MNQGASPVSSCPRYQHGTVQHVHLAIAGVTLL